MMEFKNSIPLFADLKNDALRERYTCTCTYMYYITCNGSCYISVVNRNSSSTITAMHTHIDNIHTYMYIVTHKKVESLGHEAEALAEMVHA